MRKCLFNVVLLSAFVFPLIAKAQTAPSVPDTAAPAAAVAAPPSANWMEYKNPYAAGQNDLSTANRTNEEIISWSVKAVSEVLSFNAGEFNSDIKAYKKYFLKNGWAEYANYMKESKLLGVAQSDKYYINTITDGTPMIVNSGSINGAYHWVVRVPIITTVNQPGADGEQKPISSSKVKVDAMISRASQGGVDGLAIEYWRLNLSSDNNVTK